MFGPRKHTELELKLLARVTELIKTNKELNNQVAYLVSSSKRWASKFANPMYAVPRKVIDAMQAESEAYKEKTRAEIVALRARNALLRERILDLTEQQYDDKFGSPTGNTEVSFELATNHITATPTETDKKVVALQLNEGWRKRFANLSAHKP